MPRLHRSFTPQSQSGQQQRTPFNYCLSVFRASQLLPYLCLRHFLSGACRLLISLTEQLATSNSRDSSLSSSHFTLICGSRCRTTTISCRSLTRNSEAPPFRLGKSTHLTSILHRYDFEYEDDDDVDAGVS